MTAAPDFDWIDDASIIIREQRAVAIHPNRHGDVVVRSERAWDEEDDTTVVIAKEHAVSVAYAILDAAGMGDIRFYRPSSSGGGFEDVDVPASTACAAPPCKEKSQDRTAAERQRRYRQRHGHRNGGQRDSNVEPTVTQDDSHDAPRDGELPLEARDA